MNEDLAVKSIKVAAEVRLDGPGLYPIPGSVQKYCSKKIFCVLQNIYSSSFHSNIYFLSFVTSIHVNTHFQLSYGK